MAHAVVSTSGDGAPRHVFVTPELAPDVAGGAGVVVAELATRLVAEGRPVTVILAADAPDARAPEGVELRIVPPSEPSEQAPTPFVARSRDAAHALAAVVAAEDVDRVEIVDFDGLAYWALAHREELGLARVPLLVRLHGPVDLMREAMGVGHVEWDAVVAMERAAFVMADAVLAPSTAMAELAAARWSLEPERVLEAVPPLPPLPARPQRRPAATPEMVCVGRLGEVKGSHDLVDAALRALDAGADLRVRFLGGDGWSAAAGTSMRRWLADRIPDDCADRISFADSVDRDALPAALASAWAVVVPSRFESFCLVAHEARAMGLPVIVRDLPAFRPFLHEGTGALVAPDSVDGLAAALVRMASDDELRERLAAAPAPTYPDPLEGYRRPPPTPRHPRTQAGLATAAAKQVEAALTAAAAPARAGRASAAAGRLLRALPDPMARLAVRALPQGVKDRFRGLASWPEEVQRRAHQARREAVAQRIAAGAFPELETPDVTVVIPCYNHGHFVHDALTSVFEQDHGSWEVVVVDDGSTDPDTMAVLDALDLPRVRVVRQANTGLPGARNTGMRAARGRCFVTLDADDELEPGYVSTLLRALDAHPDAAFAHCWATLFGDVSALWVPRPYNPYQLLLSNSVIQCVLLRREAWESVGGYAEDMTQGHEDWDMWLSLLAAGWGEVGVREPLLRYRKHGVSMSVEAEARFERIRAGMPQRHPSLYDPARVRALKAAHYPFVSVLLAGGEEPGDLDALWRQNLDDVELVVPADRQAALAARAQARGWTTVTTTGEGMQAAADAHGKVVVDWRGVSRADAGALRSIGLAIEENPQRAGAVAGDVLGVRRWVVLDAGAPHEGLVALGPGGADASLLAPWRGAVPTPGWTLPRGIEREGLLVQRQPPEEEGPLPDWLAGGGG